MNAALLTLISLAFADVPACDPIAAVEQVRAGAREGYECVVTHSAGRAAILAGLDAQGEHPERLTRALALNLLTQVDGAFAVEDVRRLSPADRRLLADGVRARRGRASPVPAHAEVFAQWDWYTPASTYADGRLSAVDRANIALADAPPPAPEPVAGEAEPAPDAKAESGGLFGCAAAGGAGMRGGLLLAAVALVGRRRDSERTA